MAFDYASKNNFDYVMVLHGDDQGSIKDFLPVLKKKLYRHYDSVLGARFMLQSKLIGYSKFRTFGNLVFDFLFAAAIKQRVFDLGSGLNIYKTDTLRDRYYYRFPDNLMFNYCMVMAIGYYDQNVRFYPISWRETDQVSNVKMTNQALTVLKMLFRFIDCPTSIRGEYRDKNIVEYKAEEL